MTSSMQDTARDSDIKPTSESDNNSNDAVDVARKVRGLKFSTCLQLTDPQYAATKLCLAPAEGQTLLDLMLDTNAEVLAFLGKFPFGTGSLTDEHEVTLTSKKCFIQRLLNCDKRFASNANYLFFAQYVMEMKQIRENITGAMQITAGCKSASVVSNA